MVKHTLGLGLAGQDGGIGDKSANDVGVNIGCGSSVLDVALAVVLGHGGRNTERGSSISNTVGEFLAAGGLMNTSQSLLVVVTVDRDMQLVLFTEGAHHVLDVLHTLGTGSHSLGGVVGVAAGAIPLGEKLGSERHDYIVVLSNTLDEVTRDPQVVTDIDTSAGSDLILKLTGHDFDVGSRNVDASIEASLVVSVSDSTSKADVGTNGAVVGTLSAGVTIVGPSEGLLGELGSVSQEGVLLLDTIPGLFGGNFGVVPNLVGVVSEVGIGRNELLQSVVLPVPGLAHNNYVVAASEGISEVGNGSQGDLGLLSDGLVGGGSVVVPLGDIGNFLNLLGKGTCLGA